MKQWGMSTLSFPLFCLKSPVCAAFGSPGAFERIQTQTSSGQWRRKRTCSGRLTSQAVTWEYLYKHRGWRESRRRSSPARHWAPSLSRRQPAGCWNDNKAVGCQGGTAHFGISRLNIRRDRRQLEADEPDQSRTPALTLTQLRETPNNNLTSEQRRLLQP